MLAESSPLIHSVCVGHCPISYSYNIITHCCGRETLRNIIRSLPMIVLSIQPVFSGFSISASADDESKPGRGSHTDPEQDLEELFRLTPNAKGTWSEGKFFTRITALGFVVNKPWSHAQGYDLIIEMRGHMLRIQVKAAFKARGNYYQFHLESGRDPQTGAWQTDFIACYIVPLKLWYIIPVSELPVESDMLILVPGAPRTDNLASAAIGVSGRPIRPRRTRSYEECREAWHLLFPRAAANRH